MAGTIATPRDVAVSTAAARLTEAAALNRPCAPVRDVLGDSDIALAYTVQQVLIESRIAAGARLVGHKIGLTSPAVQAQLGVTQPDFGVLFDDMVFTSGDELPVSRLIQPKVEAEIAFVLSSDLEHGDLSVSRVRASIEYAVAALEVVDSRIQGWDIRITDTIADNASSGLFVLGTDRRGLGSFEPADVIMELARDGEVVSRGDGRACLGDPLAAVAWLARTAREFGSPLRAGDIVLSGALGAMVDVAAGSGVVANLSTLGCVAATFTKE